mgnify:CR=1 FL=1
MIRKIAHVLFSGFYARIANFAMAYFQAAGARGLADNKRHLKGLISKPVEFDGFRNQAGDLLFFEQITVGTKAHKP